jgi:exopolyphosphatase/pppGpp-phosphohydrolase
LKLLDSLERRARPDIRTSLDHAATLLDIGRSVDFFDRYEHAAEMVLNTELDGFHHREIALISAMMAKADAEDGSHRYKPILNETDEKSVERAAIILRIADEIQERWPRDARLQLQCRVGRREVIIAAQGLSCWRLHGVASRFERLFDRRLTIRSLNSTKGSTAARLRATLTRANP